MIYRKIGNTGLEASIIGLGTEHLDFKPYDVVEETVQAALENGINIMDVFMPGAEVRGYIAKVLGDKRKDVILQGHIGSIMQNNQYGRTRDYDDCKRYAEEFLNYFGYMDFGMMFYVDSDEDYKNCMESKYFEYISDLKKHGHIKHLGFSSHNPTVAIKIVESGLFDLMMFSINPAFDTIPPHWEIHDLLHTDKHKELPYDGMEPERAKLYSICERRGVAITVMKTLCSGRLLDKNLSPFTEALSVGQCIHYALTRPAVVSALLGAQSRKQIEEACAYLTLSDEEKDFSVISKSFKSSAMGQCVYCNHCLPCPMEIDVAAVTRLLDAARTGDNSTLKQSYDALSSKASSCIECGSCEKNCPFGVEIIKNMAEASRIFE